MDAKILRECASAYYAVYDQNLREDLEVKKDFELWVDSLIDEGYDLSDYTWEEMYEAYVCEGKLPLDQERRSRIGRQIGRRTASAERDYEGSKTGFMPKGVRDQLRKSAAKKVGEVRKMMGALKSAQRKPQAEEYDVYEGKLPLDQERRSRIGRQIGRRTASAEHDFEGSKTGFMPKGVRDQLRKSAAKKVGEVRKMMGALKSAQKNESYDYYDLILSHLLDEGYANSVDSAEKIMVNMSEEWLIDIIESYDLYEAKSLRQQMYDQMTDDAKEFQRGIERLRREAPKRDREFKKGVDRVNREAPKRDREFKKGVDRVNREAPERLAQFNRNLDAIKRRNGYRKIN